MDALDVKGVCAEIFFLLLQNELRDALVRVLNRVFKDELA